MRSQGEGFIGAGLKTLTNYFITWKICIEMDQGDGYNSDTTKEKMVMVSAQLTEQVRFWRMQYCLCPLADAKCAPFEWQQVSVG